MLTDEESGFIAFWEANRLKRKRFFRQLAIGLPLGAMLAIGIFASFFSGWHKRADMELRSRTASQPGAESIILVLLVAGILIVVFTAVFSAKHKWDQHEQRYHELLEKRNQP